MDATTAPHLIPPEMPQYGEDYHIFEMMQVTGRPRIGSAATGRGRQTVGVGGGEIHFLSFPTCEIAQ